MAATLSVLTTMLYKLKKSLKSGHLGRKDTQAHYYPVIIQELCLQTKS